MKTETNKQFMELIENCIKYHKSKKYEDFNEFEKEVIRSLGEKNLKTYLDEKNEPLKRFYFSNKEYSN